MMPLHLTLKATPDELLAAANILSYRHASRWLSMAMAAATVAFGIALGTGIGWLQGQSVSGAGLVSLYTVLGAWFTMLLFQRIAQGRHRAAFRASTLRQSPCPVTLDETGLTFDPRHLGWADITALSRMKDATLIHFSPVDALVVPDRDLPLGLTAEALAQRIEGWRQVR